MAEAKQDQEALRKAAEAAGLSFQDLSKLDTTTLTPLTPEVISRQATINLGTIGHVAHGKSTVVKAISGVKTVRFKNEIERNITIKLGYANAKIYKLKAAAEGVELSDGPGRYTSRSSNTADTFTTDEGTWELERHVSFVDCPGHVSVVVVGAGPAVTGLTQAKPTAIPNLFQDVLMATMLNGAAVMDAALLLVAGNEPCPQPQTSEHLAAVEIMRLRNIIILQNKIDLVKEEQALKQHDEIKQFVSGTVADGAPIVPISAVLKYNIDVICEYICNKIPVPKRNFLDGEWAFVPPFLRPYVHLH